MSSPFFKRKLLALLADHGQLLRQILRHQHLLRGSFHQVYTRCGKSNCWCAKAGQGHAHTRLTWSEEGTMVTRKVAAKKRKTVLKFTDNYRQFSEQRRQLRALESQLQDRLDQYEKALINQTRKPLGFRVRPSPLSMKTQAPLQTRPPRRN